MELITISPEKLIELLELAASEGIRVAHTAGDYTAAGIAYHTFVNYVTEER